MRWFPLVLNRSSNVIFQKLETDILSVAITSDAQTMAISNRNGEVRLFSTLSTLNTNQPTSLKSHCRLAINSYCGSKRKDILNLPLSRHLINYLCYRDIKM